MSEVRIAPCSIHILQILQQISRQITSAQGRWKRFDNFTIGHIQGFSWNDFGAVYSVITGGSCFDLWANVKPLGFGAFPKCECKP